jgi:hypothetical protein
MTDNLRDRIAAVLGANSHMSRELQDHLAYVLIRELGLHREIVTESLTDPRTGSAPTERTMYRYVTEWSEDV